MNTKGQADSNILKIQGLLDQYLRLSTENESPDRHDHLDGDVLTAFVEGNLNEREAAPVTNHLTGCSFCRHKTSELIRLDLAFAGEPIPAIPVENEPTKVADVLSGILGRIFGSGKNAVFAHQESEDADEEEEEKPTDEELS